MSAPLASNPVTIFLVVLAIILIVPLLLQRLKIPNVIGMILAGVAVGPLGFNIVENDMSFEVFGQVGILYLMFLAGLEIDMFHLKKNLHRGLFFGILTFSIPLAMGYVACRLFLGMDFAAALLMASMFSAHTLLAYPIVSRFSLTRSQPVVIAVAGTIVTVLCSLVVLAAVGGICREGFFSAGELLWLLLKIAIFAIAIVYIYPRLTRYFFRVNSDRVAQFIYVLLMVFFAAAVARWIGIEGVFGAFFGGLVLSRYIPHRSPLMVRLEFVGNALFIPYFLIGVGMLINLRALTAGWHTWMVAGAITVIAVASKWIAAFLTQKVCGFKALDRSLMYQLTNAHTAVALAVVSIGHGLGLFGEEILNAVIIMILLTCTISSLGTERAARRMRLYQLRNADPATESEEHTPPATLITVSNPMTVPGLTDLAMMMRGPSMADAPMYALHVRSDNSPRSIAVGQSALELAERSASAVDTPITPIERYDMNIAAGVTNTMAERAITEVFIGMHRRTGVIDSFFGSTIEQLVNNTNKMVIITRCFIPINTVARIVVYIPPKAQYETGFRRWVEALGTLTSELGCRLVCYCAADQVPIIMSLLRRARLEIRTEFMPMERQDEYVLLANKIQDDDLFVVISARRTSLSFNAEMDSLPDFLRRYFSRNNLLIIYPEQFGRELDTVTMSDSLAADYSSTPNPLWLKLRSLFNTSSPSKK